MSPRASSAVGEQDHAAGGLGVGAHGDVVGAVASRDQPDRANVAGASDCGVGQGGCGGAAVGTADADVAVAGDDSVAVSLQGGGWRVVAAEQVHGSAAGDQPLQLSTRGVVSLS